MEMYVPQPKLQQPRPQSFIKWIRLIFPVLLVVSLMLAGGWWARVYASQGEAGVAGLTDQGTNGIKGYVVGGGPVAAYACPDTNTAKCPIRLTLAPGTQVLIVDNLVGGFVPELNDNTWRKILVQGQLLYVPMQYISVVPLSGNSSDNAQDISFTLTGEDDSTSGANFSTAPGSKAQAAVGVPGSFVCVGSNTVLIGSQCCPSNTSLSGTDCMPSTIHTWYVATDGRMNGVAGDRIAVYCRRTGRIEVWSINDSQGHFLVSFSHFAVDAAGKAGLRVTVRGQLVTLNGDGHGSYMAAIQGGPFNATGQGDFAKSFHCYASS
jgi:hypothetical protein